MEQPTGSTSSTEPMLNADHAGVADLLRQARGADPHALNRLFETGRGYLHLIARAQVASWLRTKVDASDLVQQTLLEAYRDFGRFRGSSEGEWLAWLRQILLRNAADYVRQYCGTDMRQVGREVPFDGGRDSSAGGVDPAAAGETPSQELLRKERELQVAEALIGLPPDYGEVICLRNLQRLPFDEVARRMGRSRPAVQMLWARAVRALQRALVPGEEEA